MLTMTQLNKENNEIESILEAQSLVDSLLEHDIDFLNMVNELVSFYKIESALILEQLVLNLSQCKLTNKEIEFCDLRTMTKLSTLSLTIPEFRKINLSDEFYLDQMHLNNFMKDCFKQA